MSFPQILPFLLLGGVIEAILVYLVVRNWKIARLIADTPTSRIDELRNGMAEIKGRVQPAGRALECPMTGQRCVYFRFKVQEKRSHWIGKSTRRYWATVVDDRRVVDFEVDDGTGTAVINAYPAQFILDEDAHARSGFLNDATPEMERALERYGQSSQGLIFNKSMRYTSTILEDEDQVYVLGHARSFGDGRFQFTKVFGPFIVSDRREGELLTRYRMFAFLFGFLAVAVGAVGLMMLLGN